MLDRNHLLARASLQSEDSLATDVLRNVWRHLNGKKPSRSTIPAVENALDNIRWWTIRRTGQTAARWLYVRAEWKRVPEIAAVKVYGSLSGIQIFECTDPPPLTEIGVQIQIEETLAAQTLRTLKVRIYIAGHL